MTELLAFDLDGTLLETAEDFFLAINTLRERHGINYPEVKFEQVRSRVSEGAFSMAGYAMNIPLDEKDNVENFRKELMVIYKECCLENTRPFPGVEDLLNELNNQKVSWGIVTNKPFFFAEGIVKANLSEFNPGFLICPDDTGKRKPHPDGLQLACKLTNSKPENSFYIGDHSIDVIAGKAAGMQTVAVAYGYIPLDERVEDWNADFVVKSPLEILDLV